jgi:hypothetical protein
MIKASKQKRLKRGKHEKKQGIESLKEQMIKEPAELRREI